MTVTPKEKAKELVSHFYSILSGMELSYISKMISFPNGDSHYEAAKQCALIAVDEILKELENETNILQRAQRQLYFKEVKNEIEKL